MKNKKPYKQSKWQHFLQSIDQKIKSRVEFYIKQNDENQKETQ